MLAWVGCVADTPEVATWFGDDIAFRADSYEVDFAGLPMLRLHAAPRRLGSPALHRLRLAATLVVTGGKAIERGLMSHCMTTAQMAQRLGLGDEVCDPLQADVHPVGRQRGALEASAATRSLARSGCSTSPTSSRSSTSTAA